MNACSTVSFSPNRRLLNKRAALKLMRKLLKTQGFVPVSIATDNLSSYGAALGRTSGVCHSR